MREIIGNIPVPLYLGLLLLTVCLGVAVILLIRILAEEHPREQYVQENDFPEAHEIPLYPHPPVHVTKYGIHEDHRKRGKDREEGCPLCYELKSFLN